MSHRLYCSHFDVAGWHIQICWNVVRFAWRYWLRRKQRMHGLPLISFRPQWIYELGTDAYAYGIWLGVINATRIGESISFEEMQRRTGAW